MDTELSRIKNARMVLGLASDKKYTLDDLKRKYRGAALKNHPDKHFNSDESTAKFKEINEAYLFLNNKYSQFENKCTDTDTQQEEEEKGEKENVYRYSDLFSDFINSLMSGLSNANVKEVNCIITMLMDKCKTLTSTMFDNMNKESLLFIYNLLVKYSTVLEIGNERLTSIIEIIKMKMHIDCIIFINPTISELFNENNIQIIEHEQKTYYIPIWHTELYYRIDEQRELIVKCIPKLPKYVYIDENNNIHIDVRTRVENLFNQTKLTITVADHVSFDIPINRIQFKTHQVIIMYKIGIPMINTINIYDVSERMNIIVNLEILNN